MKESKKTCKQVRIYNPQPETQANLLFDREGDAV